MPRHTRRPWLALAVFATLLVTAFGSAEAGAAPADPAGSTTARDGTGDAAPPNGGAVFFAADGLRQDMVARYAAQNLLPTMGGFLRNGTWAAGDGLLTQATPNTGAGWYTLATGAWPGVTGSTNNTFHISGQPFASMKSPVRGTDVQQSGDPLLDVVIDYIKEHSPIDPKVEGRLVQK